MSGPRVTLRRLPHGEGLPLPHYASEGAAGLDLAAAVTAPIVLEPGRRAAIPTGVALALPPGFEGQVRARSGLAMRHGVTVLNGPGTVDSDYRGEVVVILANFGEEPVTITRGMRIAQMVIAPVTRAVIEPVLELAETARGAGGFGSTGVA
ncbi:MAG: dUTP diphosphatase [Alphaproteobacteria bacterium]|nr:dUTP diphosphatase [Alphaproteobacteria bacterium]